MNMEGVLSDFSYPNPWCFTVFTNVLTNVCCPKSPRHGLKSKGPSFWPPGLQQYLGGCSARFSARRWPLLGPKMSFQKVLQMAGFMVENGWFHGGKWLVHVVNQEIIPKITINGRYKPCPNGRFIIGLPTSHQGLVTQLLCGTASLWSTDPTNLFATKIDGSQPSIPHKTHHKTHDLFGQIIIFHSPELRPFGDDFPY